MTDLPIESPQRDEPKPQGHVMGFVDTKVDLQSMMTALRQNGFPDQRFTILQGTKGLEEFETMMEGSQWGESAERFTAQGREELATEGILLRVEVRDDAEAARVTELLRPLGIRSVFHFGALIDTQLTP